MNITFVIPYFDPAWEYGGTPRAAADLALALVERGHSVRVLTTDSMGSRRMSASERVQLRQGGTGRLETIYFRNISNYMAYRQRIFVPPSLWWSMSRWVGGADLIHVHEYRSTLNPAVLGAARRWGIPFVVSPHGGLRRLGRSRLKAIYDTLWGDRFLREAGGVLAVSDLEAREASDAGVPQERIRLLPNGIRLEEFDQLPEPGAFFRRRNLGCRRYLLFLGRLNWIKGPDLLVEAYRRLRSQDPDLGLVVAGPDDGFERVVRRLSVDLGRAVNLIGSLGHLEKCEALVDAEALVIPSRHDMFPVSALEALVCGTPVHVSSGCGLPGLFDASLGVRRFATGDPEALAASLRSTRAGSDTLRKAARAGAAVVRERFSTAAVARIAEGIYSDVRQGN
jgi:glycosyltransferase involved in cell wall biosynthesis